MMSTPLEMGVGYELTRVDVCACKGSVPQHGNLLCTPARQYPNISTRTPPAQPLTYPLAYPPTYQLVGTRKYVLTNPLT